MILFLWIRIITLSNCTFLYCSPKVLRHSFTCSFQKSEKINNIWRLHNWTVLSLPKLTSIISSGRWSGVADQVEFCKMLFATAVYNPRWLLHKIALRGLLWSGCRWQAAQSLRPTVFAPQPQRLLLLNTSSNSPLLFIHLNFGFLPSSRLRTPHTGCSGWKKVKELLDFPILLLFKFLHVCLSNIDSNINLSPEDIACTQKE